MVTPLSRERHIDLKPHEIRGVLDGRQSMLRRIVKPQPSSDVTHAGTLANSDGDLQFVWMKGPGKDIDEDQIVGEFFRCPFGVPGDRLWVKHAHWYTPASDLTQAIVWSPEFPRCINRDHKGTWISDLASTQSDIDRHGGFRKRPSIHMLRWASRITLTITDVRVERVQDISELDAREEGVDEAVGYCTTPERLHTDGFRRLWNLIYGPGAWERNDWVWALTFTTEFRK